MTIPGSFEYFSKTLSENKSLLNKEVIVTPFQFRLRKQVHNMSQFDWTCNAHTTYVMDLWKVKGHLASTYWLKNPSIYVAWDILQHTFYIFHYITAGLWSDVFIL